MTERNRIKVLLVDEQAAESELVLSGPADARAPGFAAIDGGPVGERFFALSQDLMCVVDRDRKIVAVNPAFETVLGWPAEALDGVRFADFVHPDDVVATDSARGEVVDSSRLVDFVNRVRKYDGTYLWVRWTASIDPVTGLTYAVGKDMTERDQIRLAAIVNHSDDAIVGKDLDLRITSWNRGAERMYGYRAEEIVGQPIGMLIPPERDGEDGAIIRRVLEGEMVDHVETVRVRRDGSKLDVSVSVSAIRDPTGRISGASSIARDISQSRALVGAQDQVIERLLLAAEFRDDATGRHVARMSGLCGRIAGALGWNAKRVGDLESAASMHDVGKIAIPDSILLKPGPLTDGERAVMQTHAEVGERMLSGTGIAVIDGAAEIALTHHERVDGSGYPRGLCGEEIPISGRIASAADVFDALTSDRVYRPAFTRGQAVVMMCAESGTKFDSTVLGALLSVLDAEGLAPNADQQDDGDVWSERRLAARQAAANVGQAAADRDQAAADRDRAAADRDQFQADSDQRSLSRDHAGAGRATAAADRDHAAADRDRSDQRSSDRTLAASDRDQAAADRQYAAADRQQATADRLTAELDRAQATAELRRAQSDELTGALGRELGMVVLQREINRARHGTGNLVLAYVDVDGLKEVNDSHGHDSGDVLLRHVVSVIRGHLRSYDPIVRVGGDEFVCAMGNTVPDDARHRFRAIAATIDQTRPGASISVGFAALRPDDTLPRLTRRGDKALYEAKHAR